MIKSLLLAAALAATSIVSSQAHCGTCDLKDDKKGKCEEKEGEKGECDKDKKDSKKSEEKK
ncbi:MAG: hypothetical protein EBS96_01550 [Spartobacteria bacterium]|nr:hypothetical protein [Spartobacteria bacterium]